MSQLNHSQHNSSKHNKSSTKQGSSSHQISQEHSQHSRNPSIHAQEASTSLVHNGNNGSFDTSPLIDLDHSSPQIYINSVPHSQHTITAIQQQVGDAVIRVEAEIVGADSVDYFGRGGGPEAHGNLSRTIEMVNSNIDTTQEGNEVESMVKGRFRVQERPISSGINGIPGQNGHNWTLTYAASNYDDIMQSSNEHSHSNNNYNAHIHQNFASAATGAVGANGFGANIFSNQIISTNNNNSHEVAIEEPKSRFHITSSKQQQQTAGPFNRANDSQIHITPLDKEEQVPQQASPKTQNHSMVHSPLEFNSGKKNGAVYPDRVSHPVPDPNYNRIQLMETPTKKGQGLNTSGVFKRETIGEKDPFLSNQKSRSYTATAFKKMEHLSEQSPQDQQLANHAQSLFKSHHDNESHLQHHHHHHGHNHQHHGCGHAVTIGKTQFQESHFMGDYDYENQPADTHTNLLNHSFAHTLVPHGDLASSKQILNFSNDCGDDANDDPDLLSPNAIVQTNNIEIEVAFIGQDKDDEEVNEEDDHLADKEDNMVGQNDNEDAGSNKSDNEDGSKQLKQDVVISRLDEDQEIEEEDEEAVSPENNPTNKDKEDRENEADGENEDDEGVEKDQSYEEQVEDSSQKGQQVNIDDLTERDSQSLDKGSLRQTDDPYFYRTSPTNKEQEVQQEMSEIPLITHKKAQQEIHESQTIQKVNGANGVTHAIQNDIPSDKSQQDAESPGESKSNSISSLQHQLLPKRQRFVTRDYTQEHRKIDELGHEANGFQFDETNILTREEIQRQLNHQIQVEDANSVGSNFAEVVNEQNQFDMNRMNWNTRSESQQVQELSMLQRQISPNFMGLQVVERETNDGKEIESFIHGSKASFLQQPMKLRLDSDAAEFNINNGTLGNISQNIPDQEDIATLNKEGSEKDKLKQEVTISPLRKDDKSKKSKSSFDPAEDHSKRPPLDKKLKSTAEKEKKDSASRQTPTLIKEDSSSQSSEQSDKIISIVDKEGKQHKLNIKDFKVTFAQSQIMLELPTGQLISAFIHGNQEQSVLPSADAKSISPGKPAQKLLLFNNSNAVENPKQQQNNSNPNEETKKRVKRGPSFKSYGNRANNSESQRGESMTSFKRMPINQNDAFFKNGQDDCEQKGRFLIKSSDDNRESSNENNKRKKGIGRAANHYAETTTKNSHLRKKSNFKANAMTLGTESANSQEKTLSLQRSLVKPQRLDSTSINQSQSLLLQQLPLQTQQMLQSQFNHHYQQSMSPFNNIFQSGQSPITNQRVNSYDQQPQFSMNPSRMALESSKKLNLFGMNEMDKDSSDQLNSSSEQRQKIRYANSMSAPAMQDKIQSAVRGLPISQEEQENEGGNEGSNLKRTETLGPQQINVEELKNQGKAKSSVHKGHVSKKRDTKEEKHQHQSHNYNRNPAHFSTKGQYTPNIQSFGYEHNRFHNPSSQFYHELAQSMPQSCYFQSNLGSYDQMNERPQYYSQLSRQCGNYMNHGIMQQTHGLCGYCQTNSFSLQSQLVDLCQQQTQMFSTISQRMDHTVSRILDFAKIERSGDFNARNAQQMGRYRQRNQQYPYHQSVNEELQEEFDDSESSEEIEESSREREGNIRSQRNSRSPPEADTNNHNSNQCEESGSQSIQSQDESGSAALVSDHDSDELEESQQNRNHQTRATQSRDDQHSTEGNDGEIEQISNDEEGDHSGHLPQQQSIVVDHQDNYVNPLRHKRTTDVTPRSGSPAFSRGTIQRKNTTHNLHKQVTSDHRHSQHTTRVSHPKRADARLAEEAHGRRKSKRRNNDEQQQIIDLQRQIEMLQRQLNEQMTMSGRFKKSSKNQTKSNGNDYKLRK